MESAQFDPVNIALIGVSNFAENHLHSIRTLEEEGIAQQSCVVICNPDECQQAIDDYNQRGIKIYQAYQQMLEQEQGDTELVALPVGLHDHAEMSIAAMEAGYDVMCEKGPAATIQDMDAMIAASQRTGHFLDIGFQNQSKNDVRHLKRRICEGKLGEILDIRVMATWVRDDAYYARNSWAGRYTLEGKYVLDGPTNNALAHYLMNALYWASTEWQQTAVPAKIRGEIYKAHPIQGEDTSGIEVITEDGTRIIYLATLAGEFEFGPVTHIYGTKGQAYWAQEGSVVIMYHNGAREYVTHDGQPEHVEVFRNACRYLRGVDEELNCPVAMTRSHTLTLNGAYESSAAIHKIPDQYITREPRDDSVFTGINNIWDDMYRCGREGKLYSNADIPWAQSSEWLDLEDYDHFDLKLS